jgi:peptidoglycan hydrolase-like protein with peptidoglycan-binding domain
MRPSVSCNTLPVLHRNDNATTPNPDVQYLQGRLKLYGFDDIKIDGFFGKKTEDAVKDFQARSEDPSSVVDGIVGPITWRALSACV